MGARNLLGVRREKRAGKPLWIIDFRYTDKYGKRCRYHRDASVQIGPAARAEAAVAMQRALATGDLDLPEKAPVPTLEAFVENCWKRLFLSRYRPETRIRYLGMLEHDILPRFAAVPIDQIGAMEVRALAAELRGRGVQSWPHTWCPSRRS
jgi:hypothetical protein